MLGAGLLLVLISVSGMDVIVNGLYSSVDIERH